MEFTLSAMTMPNDKAISRWRSAVIGAETGAKARVEQARTARSRSSLRTVGQQWVNDIKENVAAILDGSEKPCRRMRCGFLRLRSELRPGRDV